MILCSLKHGLPRSRAFFPSVWESRTEIKHIIYIVKENRTYDQEFGIFRMPTVDPQAGHLGEKVTPNQHALAKRVCRRSTIYIAMAR